MFGQPTLNYSSLAANAALAAAAAIAEKLDIAGAFVIFARHPSITHCGVSGWRLALVDIDLMIAHAFIGNHVFVECWATYKQTLIDWGEILALKLWSQNLTPIKILKTCEDLKLE